MAEISSESAEIISLFGNLQPIAVDELVSMLRLYDTTPKDLFYKWESYCMKLNYDSDIKISVEHVLDFKRDVQKMLEAEVKGRKSAGEKLRAAGTRVIKAEMGDGGGVDGLGLWVNLSQIYGLEFLQEICVWIEIGENVIEERKGKKKKMEEWGSGGMEGICIHKFLDGLESQWIEGWGVCGVGAKQIRYSEEEYWHEKEVWAGPVRNSQPEKVCYG